jgi:hypothetical protein
MTDNRVEKKRARKIAEALGCNYTKGLRIYRAEAFNYGIEWDLVDDEFLRILFADHK